MPGSKKAPKKTPPPSKAPEPKEASFVKLSAAERKAAMEALLDKEGVAAPRPPPPVVPAPPPIPAPPPYVKESPAALRKAAVEQLAEESGVKSVLAKAPWKRGEAQPLPAPPPTPANPAERTGPKVAMTKAPLSPTTGKSPPNVIILDTNALMMQFQFHVDIEKEVKRILSGNYEIVIPTIVVHELERLAKQGTAKEQTEARMAVELAKTFKVVDAPGEGDTGILRLAEKMNAIVVTNDRRLRASCRAKNIPTIYMRNQAFLTIEGHIPGR
jgi:rRNA-processing protein FCF1